MRGAKIWLVAAIGVLALVVRLPGLGTFMTADEPNWMVRSAEFYHKVFRDRDLRGTFLTSHPGATAMWLIGAGEVWQEAQLKFDVDTSNLRYFRRVATLPLAIATAGLTGLAAWLLSRLLGEQMALAAGVLLALDPYLTGMSQVAHLDALLALAMLTALLAFFSYLKTGRTGDAVLAGILTGLALGTKLLPALWLPVFFGIVLLWQRRDIIRRLAFISGVAILTFYVIWPALWFKTDLDQTFRRDVPTVIGQEHVALEESVEPITPATFYIRTVLGRTTPFGLIVVAGVAGAVSWAAIRYRKMPLLMWLMWYGLGFLLLMTLAAKKADRYALPALVVLPVLVGGGLAVAADRLRGWPRRARLVTVLVFLALAGQLFLWMPYAIAYNNPLFDVRPQSQQGWGEGLEAAAIWLNKHPLADQLTIASWYPSVTGTYFEGKTMSLSARQDGRVGFVVLYRNMAGRARDTIASDVWDEFRNKKPAHVIEIAGTPYVWIYETLGLRYFPKRVHEIIGDDEVGQTVPAAPAAWDHIEVGMANYSGRPNNRDVLVTIREQPGGPVVRQVTVNASEIGDSWQRFNFEPIAEAEDKSYFVSLTSPTAVPGNAVTVRYIDKDILPGDMYYNGELKQGWDMAYRLTSSVATDGVDK